MHRKREGSYIEPTLVGPGVPAALLVATTVGPALVLAGFALPLVPMVVALSVGCWLLARNRSALWAVFDRQRTAMAASLLPTACFTGLYFAPHVSTLAVPSVPGGLWTVAATLVFALWFVHTGTRRYVSETVAGHSSLVSWRVVTPYRRQLVTLGGSVVGFVVFSALLAYVSNGAQLGEFDAATVRSELANGVGALIGALFGKLLVAGSRDRGSTFTAFEHGIDVDGRNFLHRDEITGYELTDRTLVVETNRWFGDYHCRRAAISNVEQVCEALDQYGGTHTRWGTRDRHVSGTRQAK